MIDQNLLNIAKRVYESGVGIDRAEAEEILKIQGSDILDLISAANKIRNKWSCGTHTCSILNAKSGLCPENCRFCAQSSHYDTNIDTYDLLDPEKIFAEAKKCYDQGIKRFGIVTSGTGYTYDDAEFHTICDIITEIKNRFAGMDVCASVGVLSDECCKKLAEVGIAHYNINLQSSPERFSELVSTTHDISEKVSTINSLKKYGVKICCGGIIGLGEGTNDWIDLAFALKDLEVDVIPLNVLVPIAGTPLENQATMPAAEIAKIFAICRFIHPKKTIKFAAGRETIMKDFQSLLMLAGANGMLIGGYLTTRGRDVEDDRKLINELNHFSK